VVQLLTVQEVKTLADFQALEDAWDELVERARLPHLSASFLFAYSWWKNRSKGNQLFILLVKEGESLVGIAPLMISEVSWRMVKLKKVCFMFPRYLECDFIAEPDNQRACIRQIIEHSLQTTGCDYIEFCGIPEQSSSLRFLKEVAAEKGMSFSRTFHSSGCYLSIEGTWDSFMKAKSKGFRKSSRYYENKIRSKGRLETVRVRSTREPAAIMKKLLSVDERSWKAGWAAQPENGGLISDLLAGSNENGWLDVFFDELDGVPITYLFLIHYKGKAYAMFTSYDLEYESDSPGLVSFGHVLRQLFEDHEAVEVDFLSSYDYVRRWTGQLRNRYLVTLYPQGASAKALKLSRDVLHRARSTFVSHRVEPRA
jgi:CelD/BcsL family acetyltransferase involved in cellulose biosynthesis